MNEDPRLQAAREQTDDLVELVNERWGLPTQSILFLIGKALGKIVLVLDLLVQREEKLPL